MCQSIVAETPPTNLRHLELMYSWEDYPLSVLSLPCLFKLPGAYERREAVHELLKLFVAGDKYWQYFLATYKHTYTN